MKQLKTATFALLISLTLLSGTVANAEGVRFDMLKSTPAGSWQLREDTNTDHKGRQTVMSTKSTMLGKESRNGQDYYWIEMVMQNYKVKKSKKGKPAKRKATGKQIVFKSLMPQAIFNADPANIMTNLRGLSEEIIIQNGDEDPMRITGAGGLISGIMKGLGTEVNYQFDDQGMEEVTVPAGSFEAIKIHGSGSTEMKVIIRTIRVESETTAWMAKSVPFGMIKSEGKSTTNGKDSDFFSELLEYGMSGGTSLIVKPVRDMPNIANPFAN